MSTILLVSHEAEQDILSAYRWYEVQRVGLGDEFLTCIEACLGSLERMPELYEIVYRETQRALIRRFPYAIFYRYERDRDRVHVMAVFHTSRDPARWQRRLS